MSIYDDTLEYVFDTCRIHVSYSRDTQEYVATSELFPCVVWSALTKEEACDGLASILAEYFSDDQDFDLDG